MSRQNDSHVSTVVHAFILGTFLTILIIAIIFVITLIFVIDGFRVQTGQNAKQCDNVTPVTFTKFNQMRTNLYTWLKTIYFHPLCVYYIHSDLD